jgi:hypothetical protein
MHVSSPQYLGYVLGWPLPNSDFHVNINRYPAPQDPAAQRQLAQVARTDARLHAAAQVRLEEQLEVMGGDARPMLPQREEL